MQACYADGARGTEATVAVNFPPCMLSMHCLCIETPPDPPDLIYFENSDQKR